VAGARSGWTHLDVFSPCYRLSPLIPHSLINVISANSFSSKLSRERPISMSLVSCHVLSWEEDLCPAAQEQRVVTGMSGHQDE
jgi:hypothetical protein